ncbi:MAG: hypothetical protein NTX19_00590, partial [Gemmatimonadetes bacterium]|nr:hypothetical protein [Gemmatimonadota bacterium]
TTYLDADQRQFVEVCEKVINDEHIPNLPTGKTFNEKDSLAFVCYNNPNDFAAGLFVDLEVTPDLAYEDIEDMFSALHSKSGNFIPLATSSQHLYPNITNANQVKANNDYFAAMFNMLNDNGILVSPDTSYPTCRKNESRNGLVVA